MLSRPAARIVSRHNGTMKAASDLSRTAQRICARRLRLRYCLGRDGLEGLVGSKLVVAGRGGDGVGLVIGGGGGRVPGVGGRVEPGLVPQFGIVVGGMAHWP